MSTTYFTWVFPVLPGQVPASDASFDDVSGFMNIGVALNRTLASASRNDWLNVNIQTLSSRFADGGFEFLALDGRTPCCDRSGARWIVSVLDGPAIERLISAIERLLESARVEPGAFAQALGQGDDATTVAEALRSSSDVYDAVQGPPGEEEGDGPDYLFSYLKCLLSVARYARENGAWLSHARHKH